MVDRSAVKTIYADDGVTALSIYRRDDGGFGFREIKFYKTRALGMQWRPKVGGVEGGIYETPEDAEREARVWVPWLAGNSN